MRTIDEAYQKGYGQFQEIGMAMDEARQRLDELAQARIHLSGYLDALQMLRDAGHGALSLDPPVSELDA